jgi:hypothetical protein
LSIPWSESPLIGGTNRQLHSRISKPTRIRLVNLQVTGYYFQYTSTRQTPVYVLRSAGVCVDPGVVIVKMRSGI